MIPVLYSKLPLTERVTYYLDFKASLLFGIFNGLALPLIPIIARKMGMTPAMLALIGIFPFVGNLFSIYVGHMSEKRMKMPYVFWPALIARSLLVFVFFIDAPLPFLILIGAYHIIINLTSPAYASIMQANYSPENRSRLMGNIRVEIMLIASLFAYIAGKLLHINHEAYRIIFPVAAVFGVSSIFIFRKIRVRGDRMNAPGRAVHAHFTFRQSLAVIWKDKVYLVFLAIVFLVSFPNKLLIPVEPIRFVDELHMDYESAGLIQGTIVFLTSLSGYLVFGLLGRKADALLLLAVAGLLTGLRDLNIALADSVYELIPGAAFLGIANALWDLMPLFILMKFAGPGRLSLYFGFYAGLVGIRGIAGPALGSILYSNFGFSTVSLYLISASCTSLGVILLFVFAIYMKNRSQATPDIPDESSDDVSAAAG